MTRAATSPSTLERQGKVRFWGITGLGETEMLHQAVTGGGFHTVQVVYNLLNPSAGMQVPAGFPYPEQLEQAAAYANRGPLPAEALGRLHEA